MMLENGVVKHVELVDQLMSLFPAEHDALCLPFFARMR
jgi:hypothetical protein